jgi:hypothetical protein
MVTSRSDVVAQLHAAGDVVLVERGQPRLLVILCPCGCGEQLPINLDRRAGPAWRLYRDERGVSLFPSVWRETGCESHFIIWDDQILLFSPSEESSDWERAESVAQLDRERVLSAIPDRGLIDFTVIADDLRAVPWDVLRVCRALVREGILREGTDTERGHFGRR